MARGTANTEAAAPSNGFVPPVREVTAGGIPKRAGRPRNNYEAWGPEVEAARSELGNAFTYRSIPKCQTVANGLRREFGVKVTAESVDKETGIGTLHFQVPYIEAEDGTRTVDEDAIAANKAKYAK